MKKMSPVRTIADIARKAGVSKSTVSRALNDSPLVRKELKARIQKIARRHDFQMNRGARGLSLMRSQTIALLISVSDRLVTDPFRIGVIGSVANALTEYGYDLLLVQTRKEDQSWSRQILGSGRADGLIIFSQPEHAEGIIHLAKLAAPFIVWASPEPNQSFCSVSSDNKMGGYLATQHLIDNGRRRIAFVGGLSSERDIQMRYQGYLTALAEAGISLDPELVTYGDYTSQSGYDEMRRILSKAPKLDAVFVNSDVMAIGSLEALRETGCKVPEDVAVVGFDDIPVATYINPTLTTIRQDITRAGRYLVQNLFKFMREKEITVTELPVELIVRESSVPLQSGTAQP